MSGVRASDLSFDGSAIRPPVEHVNARLHG
jgi:hypothetical protein